MERESAGCIFMVAAMILGSGCLTMATINTIQTKKAENKWKTEKEDNALKLFHDAFNAEQFDQLCKNQSPLSNNNSTVVCGPWMNKTSEARREVGTISTWIVTKRKRTNIPSGFQTTLEVESSTARGTCHETLTFQLGPYVSNSLSVIDYSMKKK